MIQGLLGRQYVGLLALPKLQCRLLDGAGKRKGQRPRPINGTSPDRNSHQSSGDPNLRSTLALNGYHIETREGAIGHVTDFIMDAKSWVICFLVVETGHWFAGKEIVISPKQIDRISYWESTVFVNATREEILQAPEYLGAAVNAAGSKSRIP